MMLKKKEFKFIRINKEDWEDQIQEALWRIMTEYQVRRNDLVNFLRDLDEFDLPECVNDKNTSH